jgi:hypothetical protein
MWWLRGVLAVAAAMVMIVAVPGVATAAPGYSVAVHGVEYSYSATLGRFAGTASGELPGLWNATVEHTPLSPHATITGGQLRLELTGPGDGGTVRGAFQSGTIRRTDGGTGCTNEVFEVSGALHDVTGLGEAARAGSFTVTLTHLNKQLFGRCVSYGATVRGTLSVASSARSSG